MIIYPRLSDHAEALAEKCGNLNDDDLTNKLLSSRIDQIR